MSIDSQTATGTGEEYPFYFDDENCAKETGHIQPSIFPMSAQSKYKTSFSAL